MKFQLQTIKKQIDKIKPDGVVLWGSYPHGFSKPVYMPSYQKMQESLDSRFKPIKLGGTKNPSARTVVKRFLIDRDTTYDAVSGEEQTEDGRARSRQDLYLVLKHYFPETTLQDACRIYNGLKKEGLITTWHCHEVKRVVCSPSNITTGAQEIGEVIDKVNVSIKAKQRQDGTLFQARTKKGSAAKTGDTENRHDGGL